VPFLSTKAKHDAVTKEGRSLGETYAGPISWDFNENDWWLWQNAKGPDDADALKAAVTRYSGARRGIVLMHDNSIESEIASKNQTYRMIRELVPLWKGQGVQFVSLRDAYKRGLLHHSM
jgi:peptidoglycan/xylan/chitin deacetylase (PgdA/CDA1 family)